MSQLEYQRELLSFDEKVNLAKLEEAKAAERVRELEYQKSRFVLDIFLANMKEQEAAVKQQSKSEG